MVDNNTEEVLSISFNQYQEQLAVGTNKGFWVYVVYPQFMKQIRREFPGGIKIIQMCGKSNILLMVATGDNPSHPSDQVIIWDDKAVRAISMVDFKEPIHSLNFTNEMYLVATYDKLRLMALSNQTVEEIPTGPNTKGIHAVSYGNAEKEFCIATPHQQAG